MVCWATASPGEILAAGLAVVGMGPGERIAGSLQMLEAVAHFLIVQLAFARLT